MTPSTDRKPASPAHEPLPRSPSAQPPRIRDASPQSERRAERATIFDYDMSLGAEPLQLQALEREVTRVHAAVGLANREIYGDAVQRDAREDPANDPQHLQARAAHGISGIGGALPHLEAIQASFGDHDVSDVPAHIGGDAANASEAIGANAYATGGHVAFAASPSLHTAAHEAAHVVQQRAGVRLSSGVGAVGDAYERQADAVADRVVRGESAEELLDGLAGGSAGGQVTQREALAPNLAARPMQRQARARFRSTPVQRQVAPSSDAQPRPASTPSREEQATLVRQIIDELDPADWSRIPLARLDIELRTLHWVHDHPRALPIIPADLDRIELIVGSEPMRLARLAPHVERPPSVGVDHGDGEPLSPLQRVEAARERLRLHPGSQVGEEAYGQASRDYRDEGRAASGANGGGVAGSFAYGQRVLAGEGSEEAARVTSEMVSIEGVAGMPMANVRGGGAHQVPETTNQRRNNGQERAPERAAPERAAPERAAPERAAPERAAPERAASAPSRPVPPAPSAMSAPPRIVGPALENQPTTNRDQTALAQRLQGWLVGRAPGFPAGTEIIPDSVPAAQRRPNQRTVSETRATIRAVSRVRRFIPGGPELVEVLGTGDVTRVGEGSYAGEQGVNVARAPVIHGGEDRDAGVLAHELVHRARRWIPSEIARIASTTDLATFSARVMHEEAEAQATNLDLRRALLRSRGSTWSWGRPVNVEAGSDTYAHAYNAAASALPATATPEARHQAGRSAGVAALEQIWPTVITSTTNTTYQAWAEAAWHDANRAAIVPPPPTQPTGTTSPSQTQSAPPPQRQGATRTSVAPPSLPPGRDTTPQGEWEANRTQPPPPPPQGATRTSVAPPSVPPGRDTTPQGEWEANRTQPPRRRR